MCLDDLGMKSLGSQMAVCHFMEAVNEQDQSIRFDMCSITKNSVFMVYIDDKTRLSIESCFVTIYLLDFAVKEKGEFGSCQLSFQNFERYPIIHLGYFLIPGMAPVMTIDLGQFVSIK